MKIKILLLSANPKNTDSLRLSEEFRGIKESIKISKYRESFDIVRGEAVRVKDLRRLILEVAPHIIHFSGHGENAGIILENEAGRSHLLKGEALGELLSLFESIYCVVLNSCYSESQAKFLKSAVPYVVGMSQQINDKSSIHFSNGFYDALGSNRSIEDSFKFGLNAIKMWQENNKNTQRSFEIEKDEDYEEDIPVLLKGSVIRSLPTLSINKKEVLSNPLLDSIWDNLSPSLQDALALAANAARRKGKDIISTRTLFSALRRMSPDRLPAFFEQIPEDALPKATKNEIEPNINALSDIRLFSHCVQDSLNNLIPKINVDEKLTTEDIFVDIALNGKGKSVRRLRTHGINVNRINEIVKQLGWSIINR
ncbi:MAG: hypothetical protein DSZ29_05825 [Aquificaceae bacterium]|nr:MAG: hypothetical protein DSZ29_05825 [Aquificaceae bacterium]